jgi:GH18 family chitinase
MNLHHQVALLLTASIFMLSAASCTSSTVVSTEQPPAPPSTPQPAFRIVGYFADWDGVVATVPFDKLTHINYAFAIPNADGTLQDVTNDWKLSELVKKAREKNVKVLISVGGWGWDKEFEALAAKPETRSMFVNAIVEFVSRYKLDGADIDWEYPDAGESSQNFLTLMRELRDALPKDKLLTAAVVAHGETAEGIPTESFALMDFVNIMAYDGPRDAHASMQYAETALTYWRKRDLPKEKTVLGVPFYSRPTEVAYRKLVEVDKAAANEDEFDFAGQKVNYNGVPTMRRKTELSMREGSGIMFWTLSHDTHDETSLLKAIYETANKRP